MSDAIERGLGEGVEQILGMKKGVHALKIYRICVEMTPCLVPTLIVFTKFDMFVPQIQIENKRGDERNHEDSDAEAHAVFEDLCRSLFQKDPKDVPAVIFSGMVCSISVPRKTIHTVIFYFSRGSKIRRCH